MRFFLFSFILVLLFTGCQKQDSLALSLKRYHDTDKFDYSKKQIEFFENAFEDIKEIENIETLQNYANFYKQNQSYFLNGKLKVETLEKKIKQLKNKKEETQLTKLNEAQELLKQNKRIEAIKIYKNLAQEDNIKALRELVEIYKIDFPERAREYFEKLLLHEDIGSMKEYASAHIYMVRPVEEQDIKKAVEIYENLAQLGELSSMVRLGNIYEYGYHKNDIPKDLEKSVEYYEMASKQGYLVAKKKLYKIYTCKKCEPNRYDEEKAKELQKDLIKELNQKLSKVSTDSKKKKTPISSHMRKQLKENKTKIVKKEIEEKKENEVSIFPINNKTKKLETIKCYDMQTAKSELSLECKKKITSALKKHKKLAKINIIPILDKSDKSHFEKKIKEKTFHEALFESLANKRINSTIKYLRTKLKDDSIVNISMYYVTSKKTNKGVVIRFY